VIHPVVFKLFLRLMIFLLPSTLVFFFATATLHADAQSCSQTNNKIVPGNLELRTDCSATQYCDSNGQCQPKGCRKDEFPFGYGPAQNLPPLCPKGQFCPDEGDACQPLIAVGNSCQLNRDDECAPPDNWKELAGTISQNSNGSLCLQTLCMFANVTVGNQCMVDNTPYIAYSSNGSEFIDVVSRSNCRKDLYCDAQSNPTVCVQRNSIGEKCEADKECTSNNCLQSLVCGPAPDAPKQFATWVYVVVAIAIIGGMIGTLVALFFIHSRNRTQTLEKRMQYWREQNAFRQNIMQMRETARSSILSYSRDGTASNRSSRIGLSTEDSQIPMLSGRGNPSSLRNQISDDDRDSGDDSFAGVNKRGQLNRGMSFGKSSNTRI